MGVSIWISGASASGLAKGSMSDINNVLKLRVRREDWGETASRLTRTFAILQLGVSLPEGFIEPSTYHYKGKPNYRLDEILGKVCL